MSGKSKGARLMVLTVLLAIVAAGIEIKFPDSYGAPSWIFWFLAIVAFWRAMAHFDERD